jgi:IS4 transposase
MGWREKRLVRYFEETPDMAHAYGFEHTDNETGMSRSTHPKQSRLWELWNNSFPVVTKKFCRAVAEALVAFARERGIPAPDEVFQPEESDATSQRSETRLVADTTEDVWEKAKPFVTDCFHLNRGDNWQIHENAFWEQHAFMGMREDMYAEGGHGSFYSDTQRRRAPSGSNHRYQIEKLTVEEMRTMLRETNRPLIARARRNSELVRKLCAAIDITKGNPFTGQITRDEGGNITEDWLLGYEDGNVYYQWATIQIVGLDIPLVLDAMPVKRGMKRADIVDSLLENALDLIDDIELVMMDKEFGHDGVKDACEKHGVHYLTPSRKQTSEKATCERLRKAGKRVHIEETPVENGPSRKRMYVPSTSDEDADEKEESEEVDKSGNESDPREDMWDELNDLGIELEPRREQHGFGDLIDDIREEEQLRKAEEKEKLEESGREDWSYALFETNHPMIAVEEDDDEMARLHMVVRLVRKYRHRWGIENGYKKLKKFRVRTTSKEHTYRFFNFVFACVLYNVWRLVDLLVKLAIEGENTTYAPRVDANQFLTVAKKFYGLDPPD